MPVAADPQTVVTVVELGKIMATEAPASFRACTLSADFMAVNNLASCSTALRRTPGESSPPGHLMPRARSSLPCQQLSSSRARSSTPVSQPVDLWLPGFEPVDEEAERLGELVADKLDGAKGLTS
eukprot:5190909-Pyramimonas_sp.AAC.1